MDIPPEIYLSCPICGAKDCPRFIGYYPRQVVNEDGKLFEDFAIARFLCNEKGDKKLVNHKTFSLLPFQLIPYSKYSIPFIIYILKQRYIEKKSLDKIRLMFSCLNGTYLDLSTYIFYAFREMVRVCLNILFGLTSYTEFKNILCEPRLNNQIVLFITAAEEFCCRKINPSIRGPCALSYDLYLQNGGYYRNSRFLFGTPSQFRKF